MTDPHAPVPAQHAEEQGLPYRLISLVGLITLGIFGLGILWSTHIMNATVAETQPDAREQADAMRRISQKVDQPEIGIVNQRMFELDPRAQEKHDLLSQRLHSYGWVDKDKQVAHIPIERAMELYLAEQKK